MVVGDDAELGALDIRPGRRAAGGDNDAFGGDALTTDIERMCIDETGVLDPQITRQGDDRIVVQLPGIEDRLRFQAIDRHQHHQRLGRSRVMSVGHAR